MTILPKETLLSTPLKPDQKKTQPRSITRLALFSILAVSLLSEPATTTETRKLYWTDIDNKVIQRSNLDGSGVETIVSTGLDRPNSLAVHDKHQRIYWSDAGTGRIQSANLDGTDIIDILTGLPAPSGVTLDVRTETIYWSEYSQSRIRSAPIDGSSPPSTVIGNLHQPFRLALDRERNVLYWTDFGPGTDCVHKLDLNNNTHTQIASGQLSPSGIVYEPISDRVYWADLRRDVIDSDSRCGGSHRSELSLPDNNISFGIESLCIDPVTDRLIWTNNALDNIQFMPRTGGPVGTIVANGLSFPAGIAIAEVRKVFVSITAPALQYSIAAADPLVIQGRLENSAPATSVVFFAWLSLPSCDQIAIRPRSFRGDVEIPRCEDRSARLRLGIAGTGRLQSLGVYTLGVRVVDAVTGKLHSVDSIRFEVVP